MTEKAFQPEWFSAPGATIAHALARKKLTKADFAASAGISNERVERLMDGRSSITKTIAAILADTLGGSQDFWLQREQQFRDDIARLQTTGSASAASTWLKRLPLKDMIKFGWVAAEQKSGQKIKSCLDFFDVSDVSEWEKRYQNTLSTVSFRTSVTLESEPTAVLAWLRFGENKSAQIPCQKWNPDGFRESLAEIRRLTRKKDPTIFIPEMQTMCAKNGVALVIGRAPTRCRASGATKFLAPNKAMILLSFRYLSDDQFWFTFFHEAGHLLLHSNKALFLEDGSDVTEKEENEANLFAENILIPPASRSELFKLRITKKDILKYSAKIGVSRGIVVGQLQHTKRIERSRLNSLKRRYDWGELIKVS